jgi:membrane protein implicated in regulation of membrane protease activity
MADSCTGRVHILRATFAGFVSLGSMQIVRILIAAVIAVAALLAGLFTAAFVAVAALVAYVVLLIRGKTRSTNSPRPPNSSRPHVHRESRTGGDVIDIEASEVHGVNAESPAQRD